MARAITLRHPETNEVRKGYYGFSWTGLFFGGLPALARGNMKIGIFMLALAISPFVLHNAFSRSLAGFFYIFLSIVFACEYNRYYTLSLLDEGFQFFDRAEFVAAAKRSLGYSAANVLNIFGRRAAKPAKPATPPDSSKAA
ncbi:MAG: hypothetical protein GC202_03155 [Alphaproteobacteria bacterium]|nr:hypothetical protein [Alphaproteobacteria bacterium]